MEDSAKLIATVECPICHGPTYRLVKMDVSKPEIDIVCDNCQTTIGKVEDYFVKNCDD